MRPCNQCRQPIENKDLICARCEALNLERGVKPKPHVGINCENESHSPNPRDYSLNTLAILMGATAMLMCALGGLALADLRGFVTGGAVGLLGGLILYSLFTS